MSNKCTLRKVNEGVVATVDERPKIGDYWYSEKLKHSPIVHLSKWQHLFVNHTDHTIIASTFGVGKELVAHYIGFEPKFNINGVLEFGKQYEYTETETNVIIKL